MDYTSCLEVYRLWKGAIVKNKKIYIAKSIMWFLLWLYISSIQRDVMIISKITKDFEIICFSIFVAIMNFLSIYYCLKNINTYLREKIMEDNKND